LGGQFRLVVATEIEPAAILARRGAGRRGLRCGQGWLSLAPVDERLTVGVARLVVCTSVGQPDRAVYILYRRPQDLLVFWRARGGLRAPRCPPAFRRVPAGSVPGPGRRRPGRRSG